MRHPSLVATRWATFLVACVLSGFALLEQWGKTTSDTKTPLIENPADFLHRALSLWNPQTSLGELQNQAYGYLFPQGPFFLLAQLAHVPAWISERGWSVAVLLLGCEGARLLARGMGMTPWPAWMAGMAYGLNPHVMAQVGVRSAEILPGAALPWVVLPLVLHLTGRLGGRRAVVFSVAAFAFSGAVNGTATAAPLVLVVVLLIWARRRGMVRRRLVAGWFALTAVMSLWWIASLMRLNSYAPPFFDYVEDARATTGTTGAEASLRGLSNWVNYTYVGGSPGWPAGFDLAYSPWLTLATGLLATAAVLGLVTWRSPWRVPMVASAAVGLGLLVAGHSAEGGSLVAHLLQDLLDGPFALLRNVHKIDPVLRLPLALGIGSAFARALSYGDLRGRVSPVRVAGLIAPWLVAGLTLGMAQPAVAMNLRTPGWTETPAYWDQAAAFLDHAQKPARTWIVPGSGFGVQTWGWTMDEPLAAVADSEWVTRSQVPLTPPATIRMLSSVEKLLDTGAGSPYLGTMLERLGIGYVLVRHDLDPSLSEAPVSRLTSLALARSNGLRRVATFGSAGLGPAVEIFRVSQAVAARDITLTPESDVVTVAGASTDVMEAVGRGLIGAHQATVVQGDDGWSRPADIVGDTFRNVERDFGRVHDTEGNVRAWAEPSHSTRVVPDYPGNAGSRPIDAVYDTIRYADASSSQAFPNVVGAVHPEDAPASAFDGDPSTAWHSAYYQRPRGQWVEAVLPSARTWGKVTVVSPTDDDGSRVTRWRVVAGGRSRTAEVDPFTGSATVNLGGVSSDRLRIIADRVYGDPDSGPAEIADVKAEPFPASRTLVVPDYRLVDDPVFAFSATPETRACIPTLLGPDCDANRARASEESIGIDRTVTVPSDGTWVLSGTAVARSTPATATLLDPVWGRVMMRSSSTFRNDPGVSARMAYDANPGSSWIADPRDEEPKLTIDFARPHKISRISVSRPAAPAVAPESAVLRSSGKVRRVKLSTFGTFRPLTTSHLEITFSNSTRQGSPIGIGDLRLGPEDVAVPLDGAATSGAVCGFGPQLHVDGRVYQSRMSGPLGNIASGGPLQIIPCDGDIRLDAGPHRITIASTSQFQPVDVTLVPSSIEPPVGKQTAKRTVEVVSAEPSRQEIRVGAGPASLLGTGRNVNAGWVAELDGKRLPVQRIDGWAQGWRVPAGRAGTIEIRFQPERSYVAILVGGLALGAVILLVALVLLARTRLRPGTQPAFPEPRPQPTTRWRRALRSPVPGIVAVFGIAVLVTGVAAPLAAVLLALAVWLRLPPRVFAAVLLGAAAVVAAVTLSGGRTQQIPVADLLAATGFLVALGELRWAEPRHRGGLHGGPP